MARTSFSSTLLVKEMRKRAVPAGTGRHFYVTAKGYDQSSNAMASIVYFVSQ